MSGTWAYDGSCEGLLILAYKAYAEGRSPETVANALAEEGELFALLGPAPFEAEASGASSEDIARKAEAAGSALRSFSGELFDLVLRIWMSEEALELPLLRICAEAGLHGPEVIADHSSADLRALSRASRRVNREIHRLEGLARFSPGPGGVYSAPLEPDANVTAALLPHFSRRFGSEDFALVDVRRRLAFARRLGAFESATGEAALAYLPPREEAQPSAPAQATLTQVDEEAQLWRRYFKATENPARRNPELQRRLMPIRYWRYLPEMGGGSIPGTS
jgi:probable DNA metabolism protein